MATTKQEMINETILSPAPAEKPPEKKRKK